MERVLRIRNYLFVDMQPLAYVIFLPQKNFAIVLNKNFHLLQMMTLLIFIF